MMNSSRRDSWLYTTAVLQFLLYVARNACTTKLMPATTRFTETSDPITLWHSDVSITE